MEDLQEDSNPQPWENDARKFLDEGADQFKKQDDLD